MFLVTKRKCQRQEKRDKSIRHAQNENIFLMWVVIGILEA